MGSVATPRFYPDCVSVAASAAIEDRCSVATRCFRQCRARDVVQENKEERKSISTDFFLFKLRVWLYLWLLVYVFDVDGSCISWTNEESSHGRSR
jgi:hypothetical protein